jgi:hypothetical protein
MLMQEAEVHSSTGITIDRTQATIWQALQVRSNATEVCSNVALHCFLSGMCARTQMRKKRLQVYKRYGIGSSALDHKYYDQSHCLIFQNLKSSNKLAKHYSKN